MRNKILTLAVGLALIAGAIGAQQSFLVPLSDPGKPVTLEASILTGSISVVGYEGSEIQVEARIEEDEEDEELEEEGREGLRRIPSYSAGVTVEEKDNRVEISSDWSMQDIHLQLRVPVRTSLNLRNVNGDLVQVDGVSGTHELSHTNGDIEATNMRGSVVANTTNGDVFVELLEVDPDVPMSFSSWNGDIEVVVPASTRATLRMQSGRGDIYTDLDLQLLPTKPKITQEQEGGGYRVRMEQAVEGTVGGGGPEIRFKTFNGDIIFRKPK